MSSLCGLPPPFFAPPACGLARAFGGWVCFCRLRSFSSVFSSAVLCGAGFFVGFGCEVALGGLGGGGTGGGGAGSGGVGSGGCASGGLGGAAGCCGVIAGAGDGEGGGTGAGGTGKGGAVACGGGGGGGGGGGADSIGCGVGGWGVGGAGVVSAAWAGAGTAAGVGAFTDVAARPSNTIAMVASSGTSGGLTKGRPTSSSIRIVRWTAAEMIAPRRRAGTDALGSASQVIDPTKDALQHSPPSAGLRAGGAGGGWPGGLG